MAKNSKIIDMQYVEDRLQRQLFILGVISLVFGLLFTIDPALSMDIVINIASVVLLVIGLLQIFDFLRSDEEKRAAGMQLGLAFVAIAFALFLLMEVESIDAAITSVAGILFFYHAGCYFQIAFTQYKQRMANWWITMIFCLVAVLAGVYILAMSNKVDDFYIRLCGIFMLVVTGINAFTILNLGKLAESVNRNRYSSTGVIGYEDELDDYKSQKQLKD